MTRFLAIFLVVAMSFISTAIAQDLRDREQAISAFAKDVADLQAGFPTNRGEYLAMQSGTLDELWESMIGRARDMKEKWSDNPYVEVTGFNISLGFSPSIDVQFSFKE